MRPSRMLRIIALCLLVVLLCSSCTMLGIRSRRTDPMMINGTKVTCTQLDSGDYYSGSIRSLVNYLGMQADFPWYTIPADVLAAGGHLYASIATEQIVDSMNYFAWDYRPNDTDVPRMQIILERYGFTSENRITPKWLEENIQQAIDLADDNQKDAMGFATFSRDTANCRDTSRFVPAFGGKEAYLIYPYDTLLFTVGGSRLEAISWAGTNGQYEHRSLHHALRAFGLTADLDARNVTAGDYTAMPGEYTAALTDAINRMAWDAQYADAAVTAELRAFLLDSGLNADTPLTGEWLCAHMDQTVALYEALPLFFRRWCAGIPLFCTDEVLLPYCFPD